MPRKQPGAWRAFLVVAVAGGLAACGSGRETAERRPAPQPPPVASTPPPVAPVEPPEPARSGPLRIALLAPMTGEFADAGGDLANGAAMALFDAAGRSASPAVSPADSGAADLRVYDTRASAEGARRALGEAIAADADIIVGPLFGPNAAAIASDLAAADLAALSFSNDAGVTGPAVAVVGRAVQPEATRIVRHAAETGARVLAVFGRADAVGAAAAAQAEREAAAAGLHVRRALYGAGVGYTEIAEDVRALLQNEGGEAPSGGDAAARLRAQLEASADPQETLDLLAASRTGSEGMLYRDLAILYDQMSRSGAGRPQAVNAVVARYRIAAGAAAAAGGRVDAVLLTVGGAELSTIAPMFQLYGAPGSGVRLFGLSSWSGMDPARASELQGGRFPLEPYDGRFEARYEDAFGAEPSDLASVAYDAVRLALAGAGSGSAAVRPTPLAAVVRAGEIQGARGPVRLTEAGMALRQLEVLEMRPEGFMQVDPPRIVAPAAPGAAPTGRPGVSAPTVSRTASGEVRAAL